MLIDKLIYVGLFKCLAGVKYSGAIMVFHKGKTIEYYGHRWMIRRLNRRYFFWRFSVDRRQAQKERGVRAFPRSACLLLHAFLHRSLKKANK